MRDDGSKSRAGQRVTVHVEERNKKDVKQHTKSVGKEEEMKSKRVNNCQEQLCVKGQLIGEEIKICREVKRGCSKEKQMGEKLLS